MKLIWKKYPIYWGTWVAESNKGIEYRIEKRTYTLGAELNSSITHENLTRTLGWSPSIRQAKNRCQQIEDYFDTHKISIR